MTNLRNPEKEEMVYLIDNDALEYAKSSKFLTQEVFHALYPKRLPQRLNFIFKKGTPLHIPLVQAIALMNKHPDKLELTDVNGKPVKLDAEYEFEEDVEYDLEKMNRNQLFDLCKRLQIYIPPTPKNELMRDNANKALIAGKKPLAEEGYKQLLADQEAEKKAQQEELRKKLGDERNAEFAEAAAAREEALKAKELEEV